MLDENGGHAVEDSAQESNTADTPKAKTDDQYKGMQRELAKRDREIARLQKDNEGLRQQWDEVLSGLLSGESLAEPDKTKLADVQRKSSEVRRQNLRDTAEVELEGMLSEQNLTMEEWLHQPRFAMARTAWRQSAFEDASHLTSQALDQADPEARAQRRYEAKLRATGKVDTGSSTAGGDIVLRRPEDWDKLTPEQREEATRKLKELMRNRRR